MVTDRSASGSKEATNSKLYEVMVGEAMRCVEVNGLPIEKCAVT
jgi:hypothetical protein